MKEILRHHVESRRFALSLCTRPLMPARLKTMTTQPDQCHSVQSASVGPCVTVAEYVRSLTRAARDLEAITPHPRHKSVAVLRAVDLQAVHVYLARTDDDSPSLIPEDLPSQVHHEVGASLKAADVAKKIIAASEKISAESLVDALLNSPDKSMTMQVLKQATRGGATVFGENGHLSDQLSKPLQSRFQSDQLHRVTARIIREAGDGCKLTMRVVKAHQHAEFWRHFALDLPELRVADEEDYSTLMLARLMGLEVELAITITVNLPKGRLTREYITCDLANPIDRTSIARKAISWLGTQYALQFDNS